MNKIVKKRLLLSKLNNCQIIQLQNVNNLQNNLHKLNSINEIKGFKFKQLDSFHLPHLDGQNIEEHVTEKANQQVEGYLKLIKSFQQLPKMPTSFSFSPGWSR